MKRTLKPKPQTMLLWLSILGLAILTACSSVQAQDNPPVTATSRATIEFSGTISQVTETTIIVNNLTVLTVGAEIETELSVGNEVHVEGILLENGQIQALEIEDADSSQTPEMTPEATQNPDANDDDADDTIIVIEGPVQSIDINIIVIYGFEIEVDDDDLALTVLQIGDVIRIEGRYDDDWDDDRDDRRDDDDDDDDDRDDDRIRLVSINITFVSVTVIIIDGLVWRDAGNCAGIPDWVPEDDIQVVLIRCQGGGNSNNPANNGGGRRGGGDDDDDDDDGDDDD